MILTVALRLTSTDYNGIRIPDYLENSLKFLMLPQDVLSFVPPQEHKEEHKKLTDINLWLNFWGLFATRESEHENNIVLKWY